MEVEVEVVGVGQYPGSARAGDNPPGQVAPLGHCAHMPPPPLVVGVVGEETYQLGEQAPRAGI